MTDALLDDEVEGAARVVWDSEAGEVSILSADRGES
jgi:hypothetical protein